MVADKIEYIIMLIKLFAKHFGLSYMQAFRYVSLHDGIEYAEKHYNILHTLPSDLAKVIRDNDIHNIMDYNDKVIYPDKIRVNLYYLSHYSFFKDLEMIVSTVLGRKMMYGGEWI